MIWLALLLAVPTPRDPRVVAKYRATHLCPEYVVDARGKTVSCAVYKKVLDPKTGRTRMEMYWKCGGCDADHDCPLKCGGADDFRNLHYIDSKANRSKGADCGACK